MPDQTAQTTLSSQWNKATHPCASQNPEVDQPRGLPHPVIGRLCAAEPALNE